MTLSQQTAKLEEDFAAIKELAGKGIEGCETKSRTPT